jgi:Peptidase family M28
MNLRALLGALAVPRLVGTSNHARARDLLKGELAARGYVVLEHAFRAAPRFPLHGIAPRDGVNLIAVRPGASVTAWLAAHYDSKGQPVSMAARLALVGLAAIAVLGAIVGTVAGWSPVACWAVPLAAWGGVLAVSRATDRSPGAVDNATGVLTVLATLDALPADARVGALLLDAEELGLVGARALARDRPNLLAHAAIVNFDGIDDRGRAIALVHRPGPVGERIAAALGTRARRLVPVVVDGMALAGASAECVTIMKGDWATTRVIHTLGDAPDRLTLDGVRGVARAVASVLSPAS